MPARLAADWLAGGRGLDVLSTCLLLPALWVAFAAASDGLALVLSMLAIAVAVGEKYFALRVAFDRRVFAGWAAQWERAAPGDALETLAEFDAALVILGLRRERTGDRPALAARIAGAMRLLRRQALCVALQFLCLAAIAGSRVVS